MKNNYQTIFSKDNITRYYNKIMTYKIIAFIAIALLVWQIVKGNVFLAMIILVAFLVSIIFFTLAITVFEEKNKIKERENIIVFPATSSPDKIMICDMCESLIENNDECCKLCIDQDIILCSKCMLKYNDGKNNR